MLNAKSTVQPPYHPDQGILWRQSSHICNIQAFGFGRPTVTHHGPVDSLEILQRGELYDQAAPMIVQLYLHPRVEVRCQQLFQLQHPRLR